MSSNDVTIRKATPEDCPAIRGLIQELADYEKMPDGPKIDAESKNVAILYWESQIMKRCLMVLR